MLKLLFMSALSLTLTTPCAAEELLFTAQVQKLTLQPSGVGDCPPPCPAVKATDADGRVSVCVTNAGGCQTAEVKLVSDYIGTRKAGMHVFKSRTGEWGQLNFPNTPELILVHAVDGKTTWAPLSVRDGKTYFKATAMRQVGPVPVQSLAPDADGLVPVEVLIERVRSGK
jgi:hypothetical protein